jgi:carboxyl-terminal processing protease
MLRRWLAALLLALGSLLGPLAPLVPAGAQAVAPAAQAPAQPQTPAVERALRTVEAQLGLLLGRYATPLEAAALLGAGWAGALEGAGEVAGAEASRAFAPDRGAAWADFGARFRGLAERPGADPEALARAANRAMARSLDDCHTSVAVSHEREVRLLDGAERYGGVGASVADPATFEPRPPGPLVVQVQEGGPAQQAGIRAGDAVLAVDGTDAAGLPPSRLVELVRGEAGTPVRLRLDRPGAPAPVEVTVERALLEPRPVEGRLLSVPAGAPDAGAGAPQAPQAPQAPEAVQVGYVALREFSRSAEAALPAKLEELHAAGATHWVLDLRGNRGGNLQTFTRLGSLFLEEGTLAVTVDRNGAESAISADGTTYRPYLRPLAVLVDRQSASAAELLAADLQEYGAARLFGSTTAGCFGTSRLFRLPDGSGLWLTVSALQSGLARRDVHRVGLDPDEAVNRTRSELASGVDGPLARALTWVTRPAGEGT